MELLQVIKLVGKEERPGSEHEWFCIEPNVLYPLTISFIKKYRENWEAPPDYLVKSMTKARTISAAQWELALVPFHQVLPAQRRLRAAALETAREVFTALLHAQAGKAIGLHIFKDHQYRL